MTTTYPNDAAENVTYAYDQAGHGFGIGQLTSLKDAAGTLVAQLRRAGQPALRETRERRHDPQNRVHLRSGEPDRLDRLSVQRERRLHARRHGPDHQGERQDARRFQLCRRGLGISATSRSARRPRLTFGNGVRETRAYDLDYRLKTFTGKGTALVQKLTYGYNAADNVQSITDSVTAADSQTFHYDPLNRLTDARAEPAGTGASHGPTIPWATA